MTSYVGAGFGVTTAVLPAHQVNDLMLAFAYRDGSNTPPSLSPDGWTSIVNSGANTNAIRLGWLIANTTGHISGVWSNATTLIVNVYRPNSGHMLRVGNYIVNGGASSAAVYPTLSLLDANSKSWVVAFAGHRSTNTNLQNAPTSMTMRASSVDATDEGASFDTNGAMTAWNVSSVALGGTASGWRAVVQEIVEYPVKVAQIESTIVPTEPGFTVINVDVVRTTNVPSVADAIEKIGKWIHNADSVIVVTEPSIDRTTNTTATTVDSISTDDNYVKLLSKLLADATSIVDEISSSYIPGGSGPTISVLTDLITIVDEALSIARYFRLSQDLLVLDTPTLESNTSLVAIATDISSITDIAVKQQMRLLQSAATLLDSLSSTLTGSGVIQTKVLESALDVVDVLIKVLRLFREDSIATVSEGPLEKVLDYTQESNIVLDTPSLEKISFLEARASSVSELSDASTRFVRYTRVAESLATLIDELVSSVQRSGAVNASVLSSTVTVVDEFLRSLVDAREVTSALTLSDETATRRVLNRLAESLVILIDELVSSTIVSGGLYTRTLEDVITVVSQISKLLHLLREDSIQVTDSPLIKALSVVSQSTVSALSEAVTNLRLTRLSSDEVTAFDELVYYTLGIQVRTLTSAITVYDELMQALSLVRISSDGVLIVDSLSGPLLRGRIMADDVTMFDQLVTTVLRQYAFTAESQTTIDDSIVSIVRLRRILDSITLTVDDIISNVYQFFLTYGVTVPRISLSVDTVRLRMLPAAILGMRRDTIRLSVGA